jgi:hypothetical protein
MEYYRTDDGQIQADLARRLGIVLEQYHQQIKSEEKYEVSLCLSILQMLLTNCIELLNNLKDRDKKDNPFYQFPIDSMIWGFDEKAIRYTSFNQTNLDADKVVRHIRNALSHSTRIELNSEISKTTGYITKGGSANIETVIFISSPDLNSKGKTKSFDNKESAEKHIKLQGNFPEGVEVMQLIDGKFAFYKNGAPFHRVFEIEINPSCLLTLTYSLTSYLSHPLLNKWDGKTFSIRKIAA